MRQLLHRSDFDDADPRRREPRGDLARLVDVLGLDEEEPTELLRRLGEGAVGRGDLAAADPDGPGRPRGFQGIRNDVVAALPDLIVVGRGPSR